MKLAQSLLLASVLLLGFRAATCLCSRIASQNPRSSCLPSLPSRSDNSRRHCVAGKTLSHR